MNPAHCNLRSCRHTRIPRDAERPGAGVRILELIHAHTIRAPRSRSWRSAVIAIAVTLTAARPALARTAVLSGPIVSPVNGHVYYLLECDTWTASEASAVRLGGHLATLRNAAEHEWVCAQFSQFGGTPRVLWIGLTDAGHEGVFTWTSGEPVTFDRLEEGQPDDARGVEHYVGIWPPGPRAPGRWNDWPDDRSTGSGIGVPFLATMHGVVEITPTTAASNETP